MKFLNSVRAGLFLTVALIAGPLAALELKETPGLDPSLPPWRNGFLPTL